jgi:AraC-like DNA-binding protein
MNTEMVSLKELLDQVKLSSTYFDDKQNEVTDSNFTGKTILKVLKQRQKKRISRNEDNRFRNRKEELFL